MIDAWNDEIIDRWRNADHMRRPQGDVTERVVVCDYLWERVDGLWYRADGWLAEEREQILLEALRWISYQRPITIHGGAS